MTPDDQGLARRAVACAGWRWMAGMLDLDGNRYIDHPNASGVVAIPHGQLGAGGTPRWVSPDRRTLPDLMDAATLGCLLALVRAARPELHIALIYSVTLSGWYLTGAHPKTGAWLRPDGRAEAQVYPTATAALVAALEAA